MTLRTTAVRSTASSPKTMIVMIGPSPLIPGGMSAVATTLHDSGFLAEQDVHYISSYVAPQIRVQLRVFSATLAKLTGMLLRRKVRLLHVHSASRGSFWRKSMLCALARVFGVPYIIQIHSGEFPEFVAGVRFGLARKWMKSTLEKAAVVLTLTSAWRDRVNSMFPFAKVEILGNPVHSPFAELPARSDSKHILFLGRLREKKGVFDLLRSMGALRTAHPDARLQLAGDGDADLVLENARALGIADQVDLLGWIEGDHKAELLARARILVLPSYFEGLPICLLEAMSVGVPVVATSVGGIPELLENGMSGLLVAPGDSDGLADAIALALSESTVVNEMRKRAFNRVTSDYSTSAIKQRIAGLYAKHSQS